MRFERGQIVAIKSFAPPMVVESMGIMLGVVNMRTPEGSAFRLFTRHFEIEGAISLLSHWVQYERDPWSFPGV